MHTLRNWSKLFASLMIAALLAMAIAGAVPSVAIPASAAGTVWYVKPTGLDANTCKTPALACKTIKAALAKAAVGGTIKVAVGTYTAGSGAEVAWVKKNVTLSGGWNTTFKVQSGLSVIDGKNLRRGVHINPAISVTMERFLIRNGHSAIGGGIWNEGNLSLNFSTIANSTSVGIRSSGTLVINASTLTENKGRGIWVNAGNAQINNSTISGTEADVTFADGSAIFSEDTASLNNATITDNLMGIAGGAYTLGLSNSIVADNATDCSGTFGSSGYNLIGDASTCTFDIATGDKLGTALDPIDPKLGLLADHGGWTFTHALLADSPAINAGNPATPGGGSGACLATDERGFTRGADACDIGAYELFPLGAYSIKRLDADNTSAGTVRFAILFSDHVVGVDASDFVLTSTGTLAGHAVGTLTGSGENYLVTVKTGSGDGTLRLDLNDDETIFSADTNEPIGGPGPDNGDFTSGEAYTIVNPSVVSVVRANPDPTSAALVAFAVTFSSPVKGVNTIAPFKDFRVTSPDGGLTGAKVTAVAGSGKTYKVTVNHGLGSGTLRLDVADDDTIFDPTSGRKLGGTGLANGDFITGDVYTIVPMPIAPKVAVWDTTPTYKWAKLAGATQYEYQMFTVVPTTLIYSYIVPASACTTTTCSHTPPVLLNPSDNYAWNVRAFSGGAWHDYSLTQTFGVYAPQPGYWDNPYSSNTWVGFYVTPGGTQVNKLTMYMYQCGSWWYLRYRYLVPIKLGKFSLSSTYGAAIISIKGSFALADGYSTLASGSVRYSNLRFPCGSRSYSGSWSSYWIDSSQPAMLSPDGLGPMVPLPLNSTLTLQRLTP